MAKTIAVNLSTVQIESCEAVLDLAGQFLSDWSADCPDLESWRESHAKYVMVCEAFGVEPWEMEEGLDHG